MIATKLTASEELRRAHSGILWNTAFSGFQFTSRLLELSFSLFSCVGVFLFTVGVFLFTVQSYGFFNNMMERCSACTSRTNAQAVSSSKLTVFHANSYPFGLSLRLWSAEPAPFQQFVSRPAEKKQCALRLKTNQIHSSGIRFFLRQPKNESDSSSCVPLFFSQMDA